MLKKVTTIAVLTAAALAVSLFAQGEKKTSKKGGAILHPEFTVDTGSYSKPAGTLGEKPAQPWSATTVGAAVDGKAQAGQVVTLTGEIVDFSCYLQVGKHGEKHRSCGQKCVNAGQPIGLLTRTGALYMLMPEEHDPRRDGGVDAKASASDHMGHIVQVNGTEASVGAYRAIYVQGLTK